MSAATKERSDKRAPRQNSVRQINTVTRQDFEKAAGKAKATCIYLLLWSRSFVAALLCRRALMSPRFYLAELLCRRALMSRALFAARFCRDTTVDDDIRAWNLTPHSGLWFSVNLPSGIRKYAPRRLDLDFLDSASSLTLLGPSTSSHPFLAAQRLALSTPFTVRHRSDHQPRHKT
ncbi:hypothetical protein GEV33_001773 [Tenebrio molitor]|uniref:Uncharacterized protein n=1 Tax=Tenebrio molitor TaxID=7067 RepID=A0A8J6LJ98_TENMO|nr:hypothetical protein GEV33_001773 [Tenebrio molitor]